MVTPPFNYSGIKLKHLLPCVMLIIGLSVFPLDLMQRDLSKMPGDIGDSRFNNYVLEHGYNYLTGKEASFWTAPFLWPYRNNVALSDNHLGTLPIYSAFRFLFDRETSFQFWFLSLFVLNYIFSFYVFKRLSSDIMLSAVGAYIYAFSIALYGQITHVQVFPRFFFPLAVFYLLKFLADLRIRHLYKFNIFLILQMYCAIHLGLLTLLFSLLIMLGYFIIYRPKLNYMFINVNMKWHLLASLSLFSLLLAPLFQPYLNVASDFGGRKFEEVFKYLPTWKSYFFATPETFSWNFLSWHYRETDNWWDQFLFPGGLSIVAFLLSTSTFRLWKLSKKLTLMILVLGLSIVFTLKVGNFTLYHIFYSLPGFDSLRSVNRIINLQLFFFALIFVLFWKELADRYNSIKRFYFLLPILVIIDLFPRYWERFYYKIDAQARVIRIENHLKVHSKTGKPVAFQSANLFSDKPAAHLDVMLACQNAGLICVNGYTGIFPTTYQRFFDTESTVDLNKWLTSANKSIDDVELISDLGWTYLSYSTGFLKVNENDYVQFCDSDRVCIGGKDAASRLNFYFLNNNQLIIQNPKSKYFCADLYFDEQILINRDQAQEWEIMERIMIDKDQFYIRSHTGKYWSLNSSGYIQAFQPEQNVNLVFRIQAE